jgi:cyclic-di-GMP-binding protein
MATTFSFDVVSSFDKSEMNNAVDQAKRELDTRYDFKGTPAAIDWLADKKGLRIIGNSQLQIDSILDIVRKRLATRDISQKVLDTSADIHTNNMQVTKEVVFVEGLDQDKAKKVTTLLRDGAPKVKTQIQGQEVRVTSPKKDDLQTAMQLLRQADFSFAIDFTNFK